jgi:hypothetical protein
MRTTLELSEEIFAFLKELKVKHRCIIGVSGGINTPYALTIKFPKQLAKPSTPPPAAAKG